MKTNRTDPRAEKLFLIFYLLLIIGGLIMAINWNSNIALWNYATSGVLLVSITFFYLHLVFQNKKLKSNFIGMFSMILITVFFDFSVYKIFGNFEFAHWGVGLVTIISQCILIILTDIFGNRYKDKIAKKEYEKSIKI